MHALPCSCISYTMLSAVQRLKCRGGVSHAFDFLTSRHPTLRSALSLLSHWQYPVCRQTAVQQLAEYEKDVREAREQIGPLQQSIEGQLQAMKVPIILTRP